VPRPTPITAAAAVELRRIREAVGITPRALAVSAGIDTRSWAAWEEGREPHLGGLEAGLDVLRVLPSAFLAVCEARAAGSPRPLAEVEAIVRRPPRDWEQAVTQAAAILRFAGGFEGGLILHQNRWAALVPVGSQVRIDTPRGGESELAVLRGLLRAG
jgi:transcriptional regulator with XRE-family HTH domain